MNHHGKAGASCGARSSRIRSPRRRCRSSFPLSWAAILSCACARRRCGYGAWRTVRSTAGREEHVLRRRDLLVALGAGAAGVLLPDGALAGETGVVATEFAPGDLRRYGVL